jgi:serine/threonine-protein kinase
MFKIANEAYPPLRAVRPDLPGFLEAILGRALQKRADQRYQSGTEMAVALRDCARLLRAQGH